MNRKYKSKRITTKNSCKIFTAIWSHTDQAYIEHDINNRSFEVED